MARLGSGPLENSLAKRYQDTSLSIEAEERVLVERLEALKAKKESMAASPVEVYKGPSSPNKIVQGRKISQITEVSETNLLETPMDGACQLQLEEGGEVYFEESRAEKDRRNTYVLDFPLSS